MSFQNKIISGPGLTTTEITRLSISDYISAFLSLPSLVGFWPMSSVDAANSGVFYDISGNGRTLTNNATVQAGFFGKMPRASFTAASSQYLSRPDETGLDIIGNESYVESSSRGLTYGGYFYHNNNSTGDSQALLSKTLGGANTSWYSRRNLVNKKIQCVIDSGSSSANVFSTSVIDDSQLYFFAFVFVPGSSANIYISLPGQEQLEKTTLATTITTIQNTASPLALGAFGIPSNYLEGFCSGCFLCAAQVSEDRLNDLYASTKGIGGL
jgi:hypothetical protein